MTPLLLTVLALLAAAVPSVAAAKSPAPSAATGPSAAQHTAAQHIGHVWTIMLENEEIEETFVLGGLNAPYLTKTLPTKGKLLVRYYGTGHSSLDNYIAMVSGQGPNESTQHDCDSPTTLGGPHAKWRFGAYGQAIDESGMNPADIGCVYPKHVRSLPNQLDAAHVSWKGYMENMDAQPDKPAYCANPYATGPDVPQRKITEPDYKDKHNPFGYFHSIIDRKAYCNAHVVPMGHFSHGKMVGPIARDLRSIKTTPQYSYITPGLCHDGHDACPGNDGSQFKGIDQFLKVVVPQILASPAYQENGLIIITFDEGVTDLKCCNEQKAPNLPKDVDNGTSGPGAGDGGGVVGMLLLSPFIKAGTTDSSNAFNHYSYLKSMEQLFGIKNYLGYAAQPGLVTFQQAGDIPG
ncbi:MAG TPA: alkaline phosphatase family protein [Mycobacteriales bacterium]|nr:alkaline phosphatase family protein [Mycobacteriales bacterium]